MDKFELDDTVVIFGLNGVLNGAVGSILSSREFAPTYYSHIVLLEKPWQTSEYKAVEIPANYLYKA